MQSRSETGNGNGPRLTNEEKRAAEIAIMNGIPDPISPEAKALLCALDSTLKPALDDLRCIAGECTESALCSNCLAKRRCLALLLHRQQHGLVAHPSDGYTASQPAEVTALQIILAHFHEIYEPAFRRGNAVYSKILKREVKAGEATFGAGEVLIDKLMSAVDAVKNSDGDVDRRKLPQLFRAWASSAWVDLVRSVPEEPEAGEINQEAREEFRAAVRAALLTQVLLGKEMKDGAETHTQRRPLIDWARAFARPGPWASVRGHRLFCRKDGSGRLRIALRFEVFSQVGRGQLGSYSHADFANLCELYDVGTRSRACGQRMVELSEGFLAEFWPSPEEMRVDGEMDAWTAAEETAPTVSPGDNGTSGEMGAWAQSDAHARTRENRVNAPTGGLTL